MRQGGAGSGPWCVEEPQAERHRKAEKVEPEAPARPLQTIASTAIGTSAGVVVGFPSGVAICLPLTGGGGVLGLECIAHPVTVVSTVLVGIGGGYLGYKNNGLVLPIAGAILGGTAGLLTTTILNAEGPELVPIVLLSATAGGYLGYRLWRSGEPSEPQASLSPYLHDEGSGLLLSGRF